MLDPEAGPVHGVPALPNGRARPAAAAYASAVIHDGRWYGLYHSTTWSVRAQGPDPPGPGLAGELPGVPPGRRRATRGEVDDPPLAHAENPVQPAAEQGEVGERPEGAVPDQDVAGPEFRVQLGHVGHLVRPQGGGEEVLEQPGAGVEQGEHAGDREAAPDGLVGRLAEGPAGGRVSGMLTPVPSTSHVRCPSPPADRRRPRRAAYAVRRGRGRRTASGSGRGPGNTPRP